ncbi:MAG TPA: exodeoxyribonuclease VII large subunit [Bacteroidota bacterium]|nr:exodeoxyribonuclease VII large subunit [Bacteroidota bacterium]
MNDSRRYSVSELTLRIKQTLEDSFSNITVEGEISNFKIHSSGHCYFTLKDDQAQLQAVMWRARVAALHFTPENGMKVVARGTVTVYPVRGVYQLDVVSLQPAGIGELQAAFERLKRKLFEEGLFDDRLKLPLPIYPARIGLVTSETGAAVRDIVNVISRRAPYVELILCPVKVQGGGAAEEIASAIGMFNEYGAVDLLIVGRGGGSIEDLWAFNEEIVARAIAASKLPVISAVGHEIDYTIADFVADLRAPTPSAAAEIAVKSRDEIIENLANYYYTAKKSVETMLGQRREIIRGYLRSYAFNLPADLIRQRSQRLDELRVSLWRITGHRTESVRRQLASLQKRVENLDPSRILERGYVIVYRNGRTVGTARMVGTGDHLQLRFRDGRVGTQALGPEETTNES